MFGWLFDKHIKEGIKDHLSSLHINLNHSFSKIKEDILNIHNHLQNKEKRLLELEGKIYSLEDRLDYLFQKKSQQITSNNVENFIEEIEETDNAEIIELNLMNLTFTQKSFLKNIYEIKTKHSRDLVTPKSLAGYIYPGRRYESVRTTLSEYLNILFELGLIKKERMGRRLIITLTKKGEELSKGIIKREKKKKQKIMVHSDI